MVRRNQVFVSYSHADSAYLARLKIHLRPFERSGSVVVWSDSAITTGQRWRREIASAIDRAAVAILLVSADFLASDFIAENELPPLLQGAQDIGVRILPVVLKPCAFLETPEVAQFQALNDPGNPLISLDEGQQEALWLRLAIEARDALASFENAEDDEADPVPTSANEFQQGWDSEEVRYLIGEELSDPSAVSQFYVYEYHFLDFLGFLPSAREVFGSLDEYEAIVDAVSARLSMAGWEGDGQIRLLWLPPFVGAGVEDTWGLVVWVVKQSNNGTSWIASPVQLPFARLLTQNERSRP